MGVVNFDLVMSQMLNKISKYGFAIGEPVYHGLVYKKWCAAGQYQMYLYHLYISDSATRKIILQYNII